MAEPIAQPHPRRRRGWLIAAVLAPLGVAIGVGAVMVGEHAIRGSGGVTTTPAPSLPTTTVTAAPTDTSTPATTSPAPSTATTAPSLSPRPVAAARHPAVSPPPPPPPVVPGGPSVSVAQAADCIQVGDTNHVAANPSAPTGLRSVTLQVTHSTDGTTFDGAMDFDGTSYAADVGPFNDYPDVQIVTWTVTVTDALGRTAQHARQFAVSEDPCP